MPDSPNDRNPTLQAATRRPDRVCGDRCGESKNTARGYTGTGEMQVRVVDICKAALRCSTPMVTEGKVMEMETILALAGTGLIVAAALGGGIAFKGVRIPRLSKPVRMISSLVGVGLLGAGIYVHRQGTPGISRPESMSATFESPAPNAQISLRTELRGTLKPTSPSGGKYRMISRDEDGEYYPQSELAPSQAGTWTHLLALGPCWKGQTLDALIVFAPQPVDEILRGLVGEEEGLSALPKGAVVLADLTLRVEGEPPPECNRG